jgi:hypothetical protein
VILQTCILFSPTHQLLCPSSTLQCVKCPEPLLSLFRFFLSVGPSFRRFWQLCFETRDKMDPSGLFLPGSIVQPLYHFNHCSSPPSLLGIGLLLCIISIHGLLFDHAAHPHLHLCLCLLLGFLRPLIQLSRSMFSKVVLTG